MGPAVRKLVEEHDLDPQAIAGSGREGRITKGDVLDYIADHQATTVGIEHEVLSRAGIAGQEPQRTGPARAEHRVAMTRLRTRIAERLLQAQSQAAMLTTFNEVDMSAVMALRTRHQEQFSARHGIKLGFMSFFVKASIEALRQFPLLNASVDGSDIVYHEFFDVGVAVSTDRGLIVPVLRNAEALGFAAVETSIRDFGERARSGSLQMEELTGGTFTITNGGTFGSLMSTPILNPPQSGILGMHKIQQRPMVVEGGKIEARPMMYLALTYDHRIVDGREAVQFLVHVKDLIEDPSRLLLAI
jgi:2-oxoglutarate dehydrogenase E2 component (dihydrolipoamide succinyltransferase)